MLLQIDRNVCACTTLLTLGLFMKGIVAAQKNEVNAYLDLHFYVDMRMYVKIASFFFFLRFP